MNWYVLYTSPRAEKKVADRIQLAGVEVFLPLHYSPRKWSDRVKYVEIPLFSSYLFVKTTDEILRSLLKIYGVSRIVYYQNSPAIVRESEINEIKVFVEKARGRYCEFLKDEHVVIAAGPLKSVAGQIVKTQGEYLVLQLEQLGVVVKVKTNQVIKTDR